MALILGIVINSTACLAIGGAMATVRIKWLQVVGLVCAPFVSAYLINWLAVIAMGGDQSGEYGSWSVLFIIIWAVPGYLALAFGFVLGKLVLRSNRVPANK